MNDERELWRIGDIVCIMISCCTGAELQVSEIRHGGDSRILLRELYPMKSDLYERARMLEVEYRAGGSR
jgi:hypothetical protein